ncbi:RsfA family transcriptional regulator [Paenibacillus aestuarii]|uniref:RsfA family transcriptional regulator n=1 Tax=Paenibacillus aestuarii TaxID=516965 RepID=A0ABW0K894_9BACL
MTGRKREDAWQDSDDITLAQTVISHVKLGSTQLAAFEEAAEILGRTSAACGFRWNSEVRKGYETDIKDAKLNRSRAKQKPPTIKNEEVFVSVTKDSIRNNIPFEEVMTTIITLANEQLQTYQTLIEENKRLKNENSELRKQIDTNKSAEPLGQEDLHAFLKIMQRAKSLTKIEP